MRISDWSSDVCSSDLKGIRTRRSTFPGTPKHKSGESGFSASLRSGRRGMRSERPLRNQTDKKRGHRFRCPLRSEEHTSELQSLMRISYAVFCLKKQNKYTTILTRRYRE